MSDEVVVVSADGIVVVQETAPADVVVVVDPSHPVVVVEAQGPQGPVGDVNPEMVVLRDEAQLAATSAAASAAAAAGAVLGAVLAGLSTATNAVITAADSVLSAFGKLQKQISDNLTTLSGHIGNSSNPHGVTKAQVGLGNVDNTSDADKPVSSATATALAGKASAGNVAPDTHAATAKTTPVDADEFPLVDSEASFALKKTTWANIKTALASIFATSGANTDLTSIANVTSLRGNSLAALSASIALAGVDGINIISDSSGSTTPSVAGLNAFPIGVYTNTNNGSFTITNFTGAKTGQIVVVVQQGTGTLTVNRSNAYLDGGADQALGMHDAIILLKITSAYWYQIGRLNANS